MTFSDREALGLFRDWAFDGAFRVERADLPGDLSRVRSFGSLAVRAGTTSALLRVIPEHGESWRGVGLLERDLVALQVSLPSEALSEASVDTGDPHDRTASLTR